MSTCFTSFHLFQLWSQELSEKEANLTSLLAKNQMERRNEGSFSLRCGRKKNLRFIPGNTLGNENQIHIVPGFEIGGNIYMTAVRKRTVSFLTTTWAKGRKSATTTTLANDWTVVNFTTTEWVLNRSQGFDKIALVIFRWHTHLTAQTLSSFYSRLINISKKKNLMQ